MVEEPNLNCGHCQKMKDEAKIPRMCDGPVNRCPIFDLATDYRVNEFCSEFTRAKTILAVTGSVRAHDAIIEKIGLFENPDLWVRMELIYKDFLKERKEGDTVESWKRN